MTKEQIIKYMANKYGLTTGMVGDIIGAYHDEMLRALKEEGHYTITGFGTLHVTIVAQRQGYDIRTGKPVTLKESKRVSFRASPKLKEALK